MLSKTKRSKEIFEALKVCRQTVYRYAQEFKINKEKAFDEKIVTRGYKIKRLQKQLSNAQM